MRAISIIAASLFFWICQSAWAQDWKTCASSHDGGSDIINTSISPDGLAAISSRGTHREACYDYSDTTASLALDVSDCENFDVLFWPQVDGTNTDSTAHVRMAALPEASANSSWILEDKLLDGVSSTDTEAIYGAAGLWLWVDPQANGNTRNSRLMVRCNP